MATKVPYIHFTFTVPRVKLPGNYLLVIHQEHNDEVDQQRNRNANDIHRDGDDQAAGMDKSEKF